MIERIMITALEVLRSGGFTAIITAVVLGGVVAGGALWGAVVIALAVVRQIRHLAPLVAAARGLAPISASEKIPDETWWRLLDELACRLTTPIALIDREGAVKAWNEAAACLTGYGFFAMENRHVWLIMLEDDRTRLKNDMAKYLADFAAGKTLQWSGEKRYVAVCRSDGRIQRVEASITHFGNGHGGFVIELLPVSGVSVMG